jgi:hypothetical protein
MTICPQCGYERKKSDEIINPAECPKCGIIYSKWKQSGDREENKPISKMYEPDKSYSGRSGKSKVERILIYSGVAVVLIVLINSFLVPFITKKYPLIKMK